MSDCSKHKKEIEGISDMKILAEKIGDLHYESLSELLYHLQDKIWKDGQKDIFNGRVNLGENLLDASISLDAVAEFIKKAWEISKPFMSE